MKERRERITGLPPGWWDEGGARPILTHRAAGISVCEHIDYPAGFWLVRASGAHDRIEIGAVPLFEALETGARLAAAQMAAEAEALQKRRAAFEAIAEEAAAFAAEKVPS